MVYHSFPLIFISIHALRVEGDRRSGGVCGDVKISIHALRVEGDISDYGIILYKEVFLSTPSGWRATS